MEIVRGIVNSYNKQFFYRCIFVAVVILFSRLFIGFDANSPAIMDSSVSLCLMLIPFFLIESFISEPIRKWSLVSWCVICVAFHLVNGLYYRYFNVTLPYDFMAQWRDVFVVGMGGLSLLRFYEVLFLLPFLYLMNKIVKNPVKPCKAWYVLVMTAVLLMVCYRAWKPNYNCRQPSQTAALPRFISKSWHDFHEINNDSAEYESILSCMKSRSGKYERVESEGFVFEPRVGSLPVGARKLNVVLLMLESFRGYECGFLGAKDSYSPGLDELSKEARVFENFYGLAQNTVRGEYCSLVSMYPNAMGKPAYLVNPSVRLISLPKILSDNGYKTLWFSSFYKEFHNKCHFLKAHGVQELYDRDDLPEPVEPEIGLGMNDEEFMGYMAERIQGIDEPFMLQITSLSNHFTKEECYPLALVEGEHSPQYLKYLNGFKYTDRAVSSLIRSIRNSKLRNNTLILLYGDHGYWKFPDGIEDPLQQREIFFRLPLCIWGPDGVVSAGMDSTICSQVDIAPTILDLLGISAKNTFVGVSVFDETVVEEDRYALCFNGKDVLYRSKNMMSIPVNIFMDKFNTELPYSLENQEISDVFVKYEGSIIENDIKIQEVLGRDETERFNGFLRDMRFFASYGLYKDAFMK